MVGWMSPARHTDIFDKRLERSPGTKRKSGLQDSRSARVSPVPELSKLSPTAVHALAEVHETSLSKLSVDPAGLGVAWITQEVPFQRSAKVSPVPELSTFSPTAVHALAEVQDTAL